MADAAAGIGAQCTRSQASGHGGGRATTRATRHAIGIPRVTGQLIGAIFGRRSHGEFVTIELAEQHRTLGLEAGNGSGVVGRAVVFEDFGATGGGQAGRRQDVFDA